LESLLISQWLTEQFKVIRVSKCVNYRRSKNQNGFKFFTRFPNCIAFDVSGTYIHCIPQL
jgi:hypothetical protein